MSEELPDGWTEVDFNELLTELRNGISTRPNIEPPGAHILRISAARAGSVDVEDFRFLPEPDGALEMYRLRDRDLLFTRYNGSIDLLGVCGMVRGLGKRRLLYPDKLMRARIDERLALAEYVEAYFQSSRARESITATAKSSAGQQGVSGSSLKEQRVPLAPLAEQHRIVAKVEELLAQVNAAKDRLAAVPAILKRFRQSVLAAACSGKLTESLRTNDATSSVDHAPAGWTMTRAQDLMLDAKYGTSAKCSYESKSSIPVLRIPNIAKGELDLADLKFAPRGTDDWTKLAVAAGDVLVCRTNGSLDLIGKAAVVPLLDLPMSFASYLIRLRFDQSRILPTYFHLFLTSPLGRSQIEKHARTSAGQFNINLEILRDLEIPLPPMAEQAAIVMTARRLLAQSTRNEASVAAATRCAAKISQAILAKAFRGELVPTEAELAVVEGRDYEAAEQLLERVRATASIEATRQPRSPTKSNARSKIERRARRRA